MKNKNLILGLVGGLIAMEALRARRIVSPRIEGAQAPNVLPFKAQAAPESRCGVSNRL